MERCVGFVIVGEVLTVVDVDDDPAARFQTAGQVLEALSRLPVTPVWSPTVTPHLVRWQELSKTRRNIVEWNRYSERRHEWSAWSEPLDKGRKMTLGGSGGIIGGRQAIAELQRYFAV